MDLANSIIVTLVGGSMDGDTITLSPAGSVGPPQQLSYLGTRSGEACWMVYEASFHDMFGVGGEWPQQDLPLKYHLKGHYSLDYSRQL